VRGLARRAVRLAQGRVVDDGGAADVVARYAAQHSSGPAVMEWSDPAIAPAGDGVVLRHISATPLGGGAVITIEDDIDLRIEYSNLEPGARLNVSLLIHNAEGVLVLNAGPATNTACARGTVIDTGRIPGRLLNHGVYRISLDIWRDMHEQVFQRTDIIAFEVHDDLAARDVYYGQWPGVVRPELQWRTQVRPDT
jgi:hypothetical protein